MVETIQRYSNQLLPAWAHRGAATAPPAPAGAVGGEGQAGFAAPKHWTTESERHATRIPAPKALPAAPEAASGPPLTPAQRRLLVAAGAGIPARLLTSRPSQQAQALAQQPMRGAWRAGATYRPTLRAAATAALTAAASAPTSIQTPTDVVLPLPEDRGGKWQPLEETWTRLNRAMVGLQTVDAGQCKIQGGNTDTSDAQRQAHEIEKLYDSICAQIEQFDAGEEAERLAEVLRAQSVVSPGARGPPLSVFLGQLQLAAASAATSAEAASREQLRRVVLLLACQSSAYTSLRLSPVRILMGAPPSRAAALRAATVLAQALLVHYGGPTLTYPELRLFIFLIQYMHAIVAGALSSTHGGSRAVCTGSAALLTSVPALALFARDVVAAIAASAPVTALQLPLYPVLRFADQLAELYLTAAVEVRRAEVQDPCKHQLAWPPTRVAEEVERAFLSLLSDHTADTLVDAEAGTAADEEVVRRVALLLNRLRPGVASGGGSSGADDGLDSGEQGTALEWLQLDQARIHAAYRRVERLLVSGTRTGDSGRSWPSAALGRIAHTLGGSGSGSSSRGVNEAEEAPLRLESSQLASPSTRAALSRALVAAHLDQGRTRVTAVGNEALVLLGLANGMLDLVGHIVRREVLGPAGPSDELPDLDIGKLPVHANVLNSPRLMREVVGEALELIDTRGAVEVQPSPTSDATAVAAALAVAQQVLADLRSTGREALLMPGPPEATPVVEAAFKCIASAISAETSKRADDGANSSTASDRGHGSSGKGGALQRTRRLRPGWQLLWRVGMSAAVARMLGDGIPTADDEDGFLSRHALAALGDAKMLSVRDLDQLAAQLPGISAADACAVHEREVNRRLRSGLAAELDVRQVDRAALVLLVVEVDRDDPTRHKSLKRHTTGAGRVEEGEGAPGVASGPPLTPAQRRLLVAAGAGIPARLLSSRPSQQAQALAQQPLQGAWRAGATYRPALRAAATAALTAAASVPTSLPCPAVVGPPVSGDPGVKWQRLQVTWTRLHGDMVGLHHGVTDQRKMRGGSKDASDGQRQVHEIEKVYGSIGAQVQQFDAGEEAERLAEVLRVHALVSPGATGSPPSVFLGQSPLAAASAATSAEAASREQLRRVVLLLACNVGTYTGLWLGTGRMLLRPPPARAKALDAAIFLAQALLAHYGGPTLTYPELRLFIFLLHEMHVTAVATLAVTHGGYRAVSTGSARLLTSVPALALLARAAAVAIAASTPVKALQLPLSLLVRFASRLTTAYFTAVIDLRMQEAHDPTKLHGDWPPERLAEEAERTFRARLSTEAEEDMGGMPADAEAGPAADDDVVRGLALLLHRTLRRPNVASSSSSGGGDHGSHDDGEDGGGDKLTVAAEWLELDLARATAGEARSWTLFQDLSAWLPAAVGRIARTVGGIAHTLGGSGSGSSSGGVNEAEEAPLRLESSQLASPSTRAALSRALVAAHLDQGRTRVTAVGPEALVLLGLASSVLDLVGCRVRRDILGPAGPSGAPPGMEALPGPSCGDVGYGVGLLVHPAPPPGRAGASEVQPGLGPTARHEWDVELVPLSEELPDLDIKQHPVHGNVLYSPRQMGEAVQAVLDLIRAEGGVSVHPTPASDPAAVAAAVAVVQQALVELRSTGREALLLPALLQPTGVEKTALDRIVSAMVADPSERGDAGAGKCAASRSDDVDNALRRGPCLLPGWQLLWRVSVSAALARMLGDGTPTADDEDGFLYQHATAALGEVSRFAEQTLEFLASQYPGISAAEVCAVHGREVNHRLRSGLAAELDVRQIHRAGLVLVLFEVDRGDPSRYKSAERHTAGAGFLEEGEGEGSRRRRTAGVEPPKAALNHHAQRPLTGELQGAALLFEVD
ncbi:hypothetical protein HYH03_009707 [Edaphochlamys debaryana]|uniref:Uncharacterized protein n=1 Tax=Edaphochlamys debaryana TaxID=47281 RepID=A0A835Y0S1_9CHLO|nr:hypothetical protein HYH03_009707 [Edaphochlamys debaryana]|eukprot:KAG2491976.1 hypothetical protein HYH03_009707 [Edaphochlamys debaryana]